MPVFRGATLAACLLVLCVRHLPDRRVPEVQPGNVWASAMSDTDWRGQASATMVTILDKAQDLASGCGDIKQLVELGKMVGELVVAGETLSRKREGANGNEESEEEDE